MGVFQNYMEAMLPPYLDDNNSKSFLRANTDIAEGIIGLMNTTRDESQIASASPDTFDLHFQNSSLIRSPYELAADIKAYLLKRFLTWSKSGTVTIMKEELARFALAHIRVITWSDLIDAGVPDPFGGGFLYIKGSDPNGGMRYIPIDGAFVWSVEHKNLGPNHALSVHIDFGTNQVWVELATDSTGFPISTAKEIYKAFQVAGNFDDSIGYAYTGTGDGKAIAYPETVLKWGMHSFFFIDLYAPSGFSKLFYWDDAVDNTYNQIFGTLVPQWKRTWYNFANSSPNGIFGNTKADTYICYSNGNVWQYADTGLTQITTGTAQKLNKIHGTGNAFWIAVGDGNKAVVWNGTSTSLVTMPSVGPWNDVFVLDATHAWAVGVTGQVVFWNGTTFTPIASGTVQDLYSVFAFSNTSVFIGGVHLILFYNGSSFVTSFSSTQTFLGLWGLNDRDVWAVGTSNLVLRFDGTNWTVLSPAGFFGWDVLRVKGSAPNNIWFLAQQPGVARQDRFLKFDGSSITVEFAPDVQMYLHDLVVYDEGNGVAVGFGESRDFSLKNTGMMNAEIDYVDHTILYKSWLRGDFTNVDSGATDAIRKVFHYSLFGSTYFAVGDNGGFWKSTVPGVWVKIPAAAPFLTTNWNALWVFSPTNIWLVGDSGAVANWNGTTYTNFSHGLQNWRCIFGYSPTEFYIGGTLNFERGTGVMFIDISPFPNPGNWKGIAGFQNSNGDKLLFTVGGTSINRYDVNANTWTNIVNRSGQIMLDVHGIHNEDVYFVGQNGVVFNNATTSLQPFNMGGVTDDISAVYCKSSNEIYFGGVNRIFYFDGTNLQILPIANHTVTSIAGTSVATDAVAVGVPSMGNAQFYYLITQAIVRPDGATGNLWDDEITYWDGKPPYAGALDDLKRIIRKFKPVTTSCRFIRIASDKMLIPYPIAEDWEEDENGDLLEFRNGKDAFITHY